MTNCDLRAALTTPTYGTENRLIANLGDIPTRRPVYPFAGSYGHLSLPSSKPEVNMNRSESLEREKRQHSINHFISSLFIILLTLNHMSSYYISTKRSEGVCSTGVQVSLVVSLQKADVIVTLCLQGMEKKQLIFGSTVSKVRRNTGQSVHFMYRGYFMQPPV